MFIIKTGGNILGGEWQGGIVRGGGPDTIDMYVYKPFT